MNQCFIIQPFDNRPFDQRYKDIIEPAVKEAGLIPYRVDEDPSVIVPIEDIEQGIESATLCVAEISNDNPNVWYELGYAIACKKSVILVCSESREKFPFDIHHRHVIRYKSDSLSDFKELELKIVERAKALIKKNSTLQTISRSSQISLVEGLNQQEMAVLVSLTGNMQVPENSISPDFLRDKVESSGFTKIAAVIGIKSLTKKGLIELKYYNYEYCRPTENYTLTKKGWELIMNNQDKFNMTKVHAEPAPYDDASF